MSSSYRMELDAWLAWIHVKGSVLDIGGSQEPIKGRTKSWDVDEYIIADLESPHKDSKAPDILCDLNGQAESAGPFDNVFVLEVFDYVYDPVNAFHIIANYMKPGGKAYVSFPMVYPQHQPVEDDALRYAPGGILKLADSADLTVVNMTPRRPETDFLETFYRHERMRAAKRVDHAVTGWLVEMTK